MAGLLGNGPDDPRSAAIMALAGGLLQGNFGGGLLNSQAAFSQAKEQSLLNKMREMQMAQMQAKQDQERAAMEAAQRKQQALPTLFSGGVSPGAFSAPADGVGPTMPQSAAPAAGLDYMAALRAGYNADEIQKLHGLTNMGRQKVARTVKGIGPDGKEYEYQVDEFGQRVGDGLAQYRAPIQVGQGDRTTFADPYNLKPVGSFGINQSPDSKASNSLGWANHALSKQRMAQEQNNAIAGRAPAGYRFKADGTLESIPGGPADKQAAATADERKAATLLQRLEGSQAQLNAALQKSPGAAKPEVLSSAIRGASLPIVGGIPGAEPLANTLTSEARQRVEAAQLDMLDAALTLGTGAAYTREQIEGYRKSFFPQLGDDPQTVKDKQARLNNVIQAARIAAGRAGGGRAQTGAADSSWDNNDPLGLRK